MNRLEDIGAAVDLVKQTPPNERTALLNDLLAPRVDVGPPIPGHNRQLETFPVGNLKAARPGWNRGGAQVLDRRARFVSALAAQGLWP